MPTNNVQFKRGTAAAFANVATKDSNTIYFITDTNRLFVGDSEYTRPVQHGSELPTSKNPVNSLFVKETGTSRELYYSKDGTAWDMIAYLPATITGGVFGDNTAGTVAYGGTVKVPKVTVDNRGYVTAAEDVTLTLPASDKVTTVTTSGDGNAVTGGSISADGATLTLTKGTSFMPTAGGTFSGDVVVNGNLTTESITPLNDTIEIQTVLGDDNEPDYYYTKLNFKDNSENAVSDVVAYIIGDFFPDQNVPEGRASLLGLTANHIILTGSTAIYGNSRCYGVISCTCNPSENDHLTKKSYVDNAIASAISASDAMVFKGTVGTSGTAASFSSINVSSAVKGDTYKVITADTLPAASSFDSAVHILTPGDLIVYMGESKFIYVPSGDEDVTSVKIAGSGDTINVSTVAQTGNLVLGTAAGINTTSTVTNDSTTVPTTAAVKTYVDNAESLAMPKTGGTFTGDVEVDADLISQSLTVTGTENGAAPSITLKLQNENDSSVNAVISAELSTVTLNGDTRNTSTISLDSDTVLARSLQVSDINDLSITPVNTYENNISECGTELSSISTYFDSIYSSPTIDFIWRQGGGGATSTKLALKTDATGFVEIQTPEIYLNAVSGIHASAPVILSADPVNNMQAATKQYVDNAISSASMTWETF